MILKITSSLTAKSHEINLSESSEGENSLLNVSANVASRKSALDTVILFQLYV
jgi:hypothetical protein